MPKSEYNRSVNEEMRKDFVDNIESNSESSIELADNIVAMTQGIEVGELNFSMEELVNMKVFAKRLGGIITFLEMLIKTQSERHALGGMLYAPGEEKEEEKEEEDSEDGEVQSM